MSDPNIRMGDLAPDDIPSNKTFFFGISVEKHLSMESLQYISDEQETQVFLMTYISIYL